MIVWLEFVNLIYTHFRFHRMFPRPRPLVPGFLYRQLNPESEIVVTDALVDPSVLVKECSPETPLQVCTW